jgi:hypothetical protein
MLCFRSVCPTNLADHHLIITCTGDDTYVFAGTDQRIYYSVINNNRIVVRAASISFHIREPFLQVESLFSHYHAPNEYYHYTVDYHLAKPGVFVIKYYSISDSGVSATVGAQGLRNGGAPTIPRFYLLLKGTS